MEEFRDNLISEVMEIKQSDDTPGLF